MSDHIRALETLFRNALFDLGAPLAGVLVVEDFSSAQKTLPCVVVKAATVPLSRDYSVFTFSLTATIETTADGETALATHAALVATVTAALHTTGKAALLAAINGVGTYDIRGWHAAHGEPTAQEHFATPVVIGGTALAI